MGIDLGQNILMRPFVLAEKNDTVDIVIAAVNAGIPLHSSRYCRGARPIWNGDRNDGGYQRLMRRGSTS